MASSPSTAGSRHHFVIGASALALAVAMRFFSPSKLLCAATPDGTLDLATARFVDGLPFLVAAAGVLVLLLGALPRLRHVLAGAFAEPAAGEAPSWWVPVLALAAGALRIAVAAGSDIGLGDDGARVVWLEGWLRDPRPIWSGFWAPGHLYLQAFLWVFVRDAIGAGVGLGALATTGLAWILGRRVEATWGRVAAAFAISCVALSPVALAYGATPDVNACFAFCVVASVAAARRAAVTQRTSWLFLAWLCFAFASWSRFEAFLLAPALALVLWPRWRTALVFGMACLLPTLAWNVADSLTTGHAARAVAAVQNDPGLHAPRASSLFSFLGAWWQALTLPLVVLAPLGMWRALRARVGREWIAVVALHLGGLGAAMWTTGAGTQARYFILDGALLGVYAAAAVGGVWRRSRAASLTVAGAALALLAATPGLFPDGGFVWSCRNPRLRAVVDAVHPHVGDAHVVWIADESAYFFACRTRIPVERYHGMGRADDDPAVVLRELRAAGARRLVACVRRSPRAAAQWEAVRAGLAADLEPIPIPGDYQLFRATLRPASP